MPRMRLTSATLGDPGVGIEFGCGEKFVAEVPREIREQRRFLEIVGAAGSDEASPVLELGLQVPNPLRQGERPHLLADDFRVKERLGFERHLLGRRLCPRAKKPSTLVEDPHDALAAPNR